MRFEFRQRGDVFSTRERGSRVRAEIVETLRGTEQDEPLLLDFEGVQLISFSFADEVIGRLVQDRAAGELGERAIVVLNASDEVIHPIRSSMERRKLIVTHLTSLGVEMIGAAQHVEATFEAAQRKGKFRTPELAAELGISVPALNNRLKPLLAAGILVRQAAIPRAGGKEYAYAIALPPLRPAA